MWLSVVAYWLCSAASASNLQDWAKAAEPLHFGEARAVSGQSVELQGLTLTLEEGVLLPMLSGDGVLAPETPVGFAFFGEGQASLTLPDPDGVWLANHLAINLHEPPDTLTEIAANKLELGLEQALVAAPGPAMEALLRELPLATSAPVGVDLSSNVLRRRWLEAPMHVTTARLRAEQLGEAPDYAFAVFRTDRRFGLVREPPHLPPGEADQDRWLQWIHDPNGGEVPSGSRAALWATGLDESGEWIVRKLVSVWRREPDFGRYEPVSARAQILLTPTIDRLALTAEVEESIVLRAQGAPSRVLLLTLPVSSAKDRTTYIHAAETADGQRILVRTASEDSPRTGTNLIRLVLPEAPAPGELIELHLTWEDTWRYNPKTTGSTTRENELVPWIQGGPAVQGWRYRARIGLDKHVNSEVMLSGPAANTWQDTAGIQWSEFIHEASPARWPVVTLGQWDHLDVPAANGLPALSVRMASATEEDLIGWPPTLARILNYYARFLPSYPFSQVAILEQGGESSLSWGMSAADGVVTILPPVVVDSTYFQPIPHYEEGVLAHEIAHGVWGHRVAPSGAADWWTIETFAEVSSCMYMAATYGPEDCAARLDEARRLRTQREKIHPSLSLVRAVGGGYSRSSVYDYGLYVVYRMLRSRVGDDAWLAALKSLSETTEPLDTDGVQAAFERESGKDLRAFFDFWVRGGHVPSVWVTMNLVPEGDGHRIVAQARTDVPFGSFDIPLMVRDGDANYTIEWMTLTDGSGTLNTRVFRGKPLVRLDPTQATMTRVARLRIR